MKFFQVPILLLIYAFQDGFEASDAFSVVGGRTSSTSRPYAPKSLQAMMNPLNERTDWNLGSISPNPERCEGLTRKTFNFADTSREIVQLGLASDGRPLKALIETWIGPNWTPYSLKAFSEDGRQFPVQTLIGTRNKAAQVEVRNIGQSAFPFSAACAYASTTLENARSQIDQGVKGRTVQGGAVYILPLDQEMDKVRVYLHTDKLQLNAKIELLNGPNNVKQQYEVFTNNGVLNSCYVVFNTPGGGNSVRIINQASVEYPAYAFIDEV